MRAHQANAGSSVSRSVDAGEEVQGCREKRLTRARGGRGGAAPAALWLAAHNERGESDDPHGRQPNGW